MCKMQYTLSGRSEVSVAVNSEQGEIGEYHKKWEIDRRKRSGVLFFEGGLEKVSG